MSPPCKSLRHNHVLAICYNGLISIFAIQWPGNLDVDLDTFAHLHTLLIMWQSFVEIG